MDAVTARAVMSTDIGHLAMSCFIMSYKTAAPTGAHLALSDLLEEKGADAAAAVLRNPANYAAPYVAYSEVIGPLGWAFELYDKAYFDQVISDAHELKVKATVESLIAQSKVYRDENDYDNATLYAEAAQKLRDSPGFTDVFFGVGGPAKGEIKAMLHPVATRPRKILYLRGTRLTVREMFE